MPFNWIFKLVFGIVAVSLIFSAGVAILPFIILGFVIRGIIKNNGNSYRGNVRSYQRVRPRRSENTQTIRDRRIKYKAEDAALVDGKLTEYFKTNENLSVIEGIYLKPQKGEYTSIKELYLYMNDDCIASLDDFGMNYTDMYNDLMKMILKFAKSDVTSMEAAEEQVEEEEKTVPVEKELDKKAENYIEQINQLNTSIENKEITNGLYQTSALLKHIAVIEKKYPDSKNKLNKLYQYYLPILLDILNNYKNLKDSVHQQDEIEKAEERLMKTIILINEAMKTISATLCEEDLLNLSADMTTLEALLKKDGLVKEGTLSSVKLKGGNVHE